MILLSVITFIIIYPTVPNYHESTEKPEPGVDPDPDNDGVRDDSTEDDPEAAAEDGDEWKPGADVEVREVGQVVKASVVGVRKAGLKSLIS